MKRIPFTFEPWRAVRDRSWEAGYRHGPPKIDDEEVVARWWTTRDRAERDAPVHLLGSALFDPAVCQSLTGEIGVSHGDGIVAAVRPIATDHPRAADHVQVADRIVECVNACVGIRQPVETLNLCRALLFEMFKGYTNTEDPRVVRLLAMLNPSEDYAASMARAFSSENT